MMVMALSWILGLTALLAIFGAVAMHHGADSRDSFTADLRR
jgi:hypothetical protein